MKSREGIYNRHKNELLAIFNEAVSRTHPHRLVGEHVEALNGAIQVGDQRFETSGGTRIWVLGSGKASAKMASALENRLGDRIHGGLVVCSEGTRTSTKDSGRIRQVEASHPDPGEDSVQAARAMVELTGQIRSGDLVIYLMSGGSSALLFLPPDELPLKDIIQTNRLLLNSGANIHEINTVRKHLSLVKGGRLAERLKHVTLVNLIISDVPGDTLQDIGSGPTVHDNTTFADAEQVINKYKIASGIPESVMAYIEKGKNGKVPSTFRDKIDDHHHHVIGNARSAARIAGQTASKMGYKVRVSDREYSGHTHTITEEIVRLAVSVLKDDQPVSRPGCLVYYGESYLEVTGNGKGGRNQQLALYAAGKLDGLHHISLLSAGTDGRDGPTDAAGAICSGDTCEQAGVAGMDPGSYLQNNDSYSFFRALDQLVVTGPTDNNVMDLQVALIES